MKIDFAKTRDYQRPKYVCPFCHTLCHVWHVKKDGPRKGWRFIKCRVYDPDYPRFIWVEVKHPYNTEQLASIRRDLEILLGVCDGAAARDDLGFNGSDAPKARDYHDSLSRGATIDWAALANMLRKYRKTQLGGHDDY